MQIELPKIYPVTSHTDNVGAGSTFVAIPGTKDDGNRYIQLALEKGATKVVLQEKAQVSQELLELMAATGVELIYVDNCRRVLE